MKRGHKEVASYLFEVRGFLALSDKYELFEMAACQGIKLIVEGLLSTGIEQSSQDRALLAATKSGQIQIVEKILGDRCVSRGGLSRAVAAARGLPFEEITQSLIQARGW